MVARLYSIVCVHCVGTYMAGIRVYKLLLNSLVPISGLTCFASIAKRFYREWSQWIITNDDVMTANDCRFFM